MKMRQFRHEPDESQMERTARVCRASRYAFSSSWSDTGSYTLRQLTAALGAKPLQLIRLRFGI